MRGDSLTIKKAPHGLWGNDEKYKKLSIGRKSTGNEVFVGVFIFVRNNYNESRL